MDLSKFLDKKVRIIDIDNCEFIGKVEIFTDKYNDPEEKDNITLYNEKDYISFYEDEIKSIKIID